MGCLLAINELTSDELDAAAWDAFLTRAVAMQEWIAEQTRASRAKDYTRPSRRWTSESNEEMEAVLGQLDENPFIALIDERTKAFRQRVEALRPN